MWSSYSAYLVRSLAGISHRYNSANGLVEIDLRPSSAYELSGANSTMHLPQGDVVLTWRRSGGMQVTKVAAGDLARLSCGETGGHIDAIDFASFGRPRGGAFYDGVAVDPSCHVPTSLDVARSACVGKASCELRAD